MMMMSKEEARGVEICRGRKKRRKEKEQPSKKATSEVSVYLSVQQSLWYWADKDKATLGWLRLNHCNTDDDDDDDDDDIGLLEPFPEMSTVEYTSQVLEHSSQVHQKRDSPPSSPSLPPGLISLCKYQCATHECKIYIIGGKNRFTNECSRELFIYDTITKTWDTQPSKMNVNRASPGFEAVAVDNVIYVFGGDQLERPFTGKKWAECCDLSDSSWEWTLLPEPPEKLVSNIRGRPFLSYLALYHHRQQILLWVSSRGGVARVYSYHYCSRLWSTFPKCIRKFYPAGQYRMAVVGDLLYCHYYDMICAYHLINHTPAGTYHLDDALPQAEVAKFGEPCCPGQYTPGGFLVHTGKGNLFDMCFHGHKNVLDCYKFQISNDDSDKGGGGRRAAAAGSNSDLLLTFKGTKSIPSCGGPLKHALVVA